MKGTIEGISQYGVKIDGIWYNTENKELLQSLNENKGTEVDFIFTKDPKGGNKLVSINPINSQPSNPETKPSSQSDLIIRQCCVKASAGLFNFRSTELTTDDINLIIRIAAVFEKYVKGEQK